MARRSSMTSQDALLAELIKSLRGTDVLANYGAKP